jgi:hypothetical protein
LSILRLPVVSDIEPEQTQVPHECSEMSVCDKTLNGMDLQSLFRKQEISRLDRVNVDIRIFHDRVREIDWLFVYKNQIDFRMRDAARFDHIFHRRFFAQVAVDDSAAGLRFEEKRQMVVKFQPDPEHTHIT